MQAFSPSDLKTILHSKRANLYYLEHCRVLVNGGRVEYLTQQGMSFSIKTIDPSYIIRSVPANANALA